MNEKYEIKKLFHTIMKTLKFLHVKIINAHIRIINVTETGPRLAVMDRKHALQKEKDRKRKKKKERKRKGKQIG